MFKPEEFEEELQKYRIYKEQMGSLFKPISGKNQTQKTKIEKTVHYYEVSFQKVVLKFMQIFESERLEIPFQLEEQ